MKRIPLVICLVLCLSCLGYAEEIYYGNPGDIPIIGDWNGDGKDGFGVYRPSTGRFHLKNELSAGSADIKVEPFAPANCIPFIADWDGDKKSDVGVYDPKTAKFYFWTIGSPAPNPEPPEPPPPVERPIVGTPWYPGQFVQYRLQPGSTRVFSAIMPEGAKTVLIGFSEFASEPLGRSYITFDLPNGVIIRDQECGPDTGGTLRFVGRESPIWRQGVLGNLESDYIPSGVWYITVRASELGGYGKGMFSVD